MAEESDLTKPSVHSMLNTLEEMKLVEKKLRSEAYLTDLGRQHISTADITKQFLLFIDNCCFVNFIIN